MTALERAIQAHQMVSNGTPLRQVGAALGVSHTHAGRLAHVGGLALQDPPYIDLPPAMAAAWLDEVQVRPATLSALTRSGYRTVGDVMADGAYRLALCPHIEPRHVADLAAALERRGIPLWGAESFTSPLTTQWRTHRV